METYEACRITKRYGGTLALDQASLELRAGEVHALMGENGAGKSTLAKIIGGIVRADAGEMRLDDGLADFASPVEAQRGGVAIIHQELDLFAHLSVGENIVIGNLRFAEGRFTNAAAIAAFCRPYLEQVGLSLDPRRLVATLPIAEQQRVAIARAISMECEILLMDEPTSALSDDAAERLFETIGALKAKGVAIVYVSHKMDEIFRLSDRITVLRDGRTVATLEARETDRDQLIRLMVGRSVDLASRGVRGAKGAALMEIDGLNTAKLRDVSFCVFRGEVLGVAGLVGAGRSELGAALVGLDVINAGKIILEGRAFGPSGPGEAQARGVVMLPEDRKQQGLMLQMSVQENAGMAILPSLSRAGFVDRARERDALAPLSERLSLKCASPDVRVGSLSGGNQQKALLARWLLTDPELIFLDDPARGIDVGAKADIYAIIEELAARGKAVLLASSELPELLRCCDRILVLCEGRLTATFDAEGVTQEEIMAAATRPALSAAA